MNSKRSALRSSLLATPDQLYQPNLNSVYFPSHLIWQKFRRNAPILKKLSPNFHTNILQLQKITDWKGWNFPIGLQIILLLFATQNIWHIRYYYNFVYWNLLFIFKNKISKILIAISHSAFCIFKFMKHTIRNFLLFQIFGNAKSAALFMLCRMNWAF